MKTIFVIAGFNTHHTAKHPDYVRLINGLKRKGYCVIPVDISWRHKTPSQYTEEFINFYETNKTEHNMILGNSFGAVVAFIAASRLKPSELFICSLSPFFKEDRGKRLDLYGIKYFGKRRMYDLWGISFDEIAKNFDDNKTKVIVAYGEKEINTSPPLVKRSKAAAQMIKGAELKVLPKSPHSMNDPTYIAELLKIT